MIGQILIHLLFGGSLACLLSYFLALRGKPQYIPIARNLYRTVSAGMLVTFCLLMANVVSHSFEYTYVWSYSSRDLPPWYLVASGYAGQEGSFMLWTLWVCLIGVVLLPYLKRRGWEPQVMVFYSLILVFLFLLLVVKNPFSYVWETFAKDGIPDGFTPPNGKGLNPLLHNIWITIHPPILFTGFAAMSVPFAFAMGAMIKREYQSWIEIALPWTLYGTAILGFGIMLGGFWAYETLGWGGFWGWDPVENSSLIPWLVAVALVHTMLVQRKTGGLVKTNIILAVTAFILVLYSTFLTRSGVLGDTSVHSFVDPGKFAFILLIGFMITFAIIGYGFVIYRRKDIGNKQDSFSPESREFTLSIGSFFVLFSAGIVFIGTSWPLIAEIVGLPKIAIDPSFYNKMHLPLAILIMLANGFSLLIRWKAKNLGGVIKKSLFPLALTVVATAASYWMNVHDIVYLLLAFAAWFSLFTNADLALRILRNKFSSTGAYISHIGVAMLMIGIVFTARYTQIDHIQLVQGVPTPALGYEFTFDGREQIEKEYKDREKFKFHITVEKDGSKNHVAPILYWHDFNKRGAPYKEPGIAWAVAKDVYISPNSIQTIGGAAEITMTKDQTIPLPTDSTTKMTFVTFDMSNMRNGGGAGGTIRPGAIIITERNGTKHTDTLYSKISMATMEGTPEPLILSGTTQKISFLKINPNKESLQQSEAVFSFVDTSKPVIPLKEVIGVEVSIKPFINFVWFGVIAMVSGFFVAIIKYRKKAKREKKMIPVSPTPESIEA
jgi:cytochrome c-type biogenesis protein CcmF